MSVKVTWSNASLLSENEFYRTLESAHCSWEQVLVAHNEQ